MDPRAVSEGRKTTGTGRADHASPRWRWGPLGRAEAGEFRTKRETLVKHAERAPVSGGGVHQWCEEARAARLRVEGEVAHVEAHGVRGEVALGEDHPPGVVDVDGPLDAVGQIPAGKSEVRISTAFKVASQRTVLNQSARAD